MANRGRILWVDDDGPGRFKFAEGLLKREGWAVDWANDAVGAAQKLRGQAYDYLILDQETPLELGDARNRWAGCLVLYWLRGNSSLPPGMPRVDTERQRRVSGGGVAMPANQKMRVVIISDYDAKELLEALKLASPQDRSLVIFSKPLDTRKLLEHLNGSGE